MKTLIAPTDFSSTSYNACLYAAKMAEDIKAELLLLHVMEIPISIAEFPVSEDVFDEIGMEKELKELKDKLCAETNNKVNIYTKNILGSADYEIKQLCQLEKPFAVIMGTHSSNVLDRFFLGSTTLYSANHLCYPVLVIPANAKYRRIKKIALATDLKDIYEIPAQEIEMIVRSFDAELEIFSVGKNQKIIDKKYFGKLITRSSPGELKSAILFYTK